MATTVLPTYHWLTSTSHVSDRRGWGNTILTSTISPISSSIPEKGKLASWPRERWNLILLHSQRREHLSQEQIERQEVRLLIISPWISWLAWVSVLYSAQELAKRVEDGTIDEVDLHVQEVCCLNTIRTLLSCDPSLRRHSPCGLSVETGQWKVPAPSSPLPDHLG